MFACDDAEAACDIGLGLCDAFGAAGGILPVRVGLAAGSVVALQGDYYGETVNVAARLVALAQPSTVAVDEEVRRRASRRFEFQRLPAQPLKGLSAAPAYLAKRRDGGEAG
jgi:adenylate cyclase